MADLTSFEFSAAQISIIQLLYLGPDGNPQPGNYPDIYRLIASFLENKAKTDADVANVREFLLGAADVNLGGDTTKGHPSD